MHIVRVTAHFSSAHRLAHPAWPDELNDQVYGVCANVNYHGHNYTMEVAVAGDPDPDTAMVVNYVRVMEIVKREIIDVVDHKNLNLDVPFLAGKVTTTETLLTEFWRILDPLLHTKTARLWSITLVEGSGCSTAYYGPGKVMWPEGVQVV